MGRKPIIYTSALPEDTEQKLFFANLASLSTIFKDFQFAYHIPNSGAGSQRGQAGKMKAMGAKAGVSDIHYPVSRSDYHGLWIELKSLKKGARATKEQKQWLQDMHNLGHCTALCFGHRQAIGQMVKYETGLSMEYEQIMRFPVYYAIGNMDAVRREIKKIIDEGGGA